MLDYMIIFHEDVSLPMLKSLTNQKGKKRVEKDKKKVSGN